jgi:hypothetical protein
VSQLLDDRELEPAQEAKTMMNPPRGVGEPMSRKVVITIEVNIPDNVPLEHIQWYAKDSFESWCGQHDSADLLPPGVFSERGHRAKVKVKLVK